ncbi:hypothetical protein DFH07DRAFT_859626 [Mycena maculata]|uniref:Ricin B lectin domain-containing protein n=1 Tax=Mycena maculata TaxID=230809 RepID=A0AAD7HG78_9AGAR|nr:hypothetical protein DFH07DRAFT_859626 [Mycena maculata]
MLSAAAVFTACVVALSGLTSATPLARQTLCNPNFEGAGVSIIAGDVEWGYSAAVAGTPLADDLSSFPPNATAEWFVQQTGAFPTSYIIKTISNTGLVAGVDNDGTALALEDIDSAEAGQIWDISCTQCSSGASSTPGGGEFASGCSISSAPSGLCASLEMGGSGIFVTDCGRSVYQTWSFWTATA